MTHFPYGSKVQVFKWESIDKSYYVVNMYKVHPATFEIGVTLINKRRKQRHKEKYKSVVALTTCAINDGLLENKHELQENLYKTLLRIS